MKDQPLADLCVPVGFATNGRGLFDCPADLIGRIRVLQRESDEYHRQMESGVKKQQRADDSPDPDSPVRSVSDICPKAVK